MKIGLLAIILLVLSIACEKVEMNAWQQVKLPGSYSDSHILSIDIKNKEILLGTYGRGALFTTDNGLNWVSYDTTKGLSWDFILGGDWNKDYFILATLGDGVNISEDKGKTWKRYGYDFFGIEYLYAVGVKIHNGKKYIPTADGIVVFDNIKDWHALTEKNGLPSQYIYKMKISGDTIAVGTLHGFSISADSGVNWKSSSPNGSYSSEKVSTCKVRAVEFGGNNIYAGCDDGLYYSSDFGSTWQQIGQGNLKSNFIHDLIWDKDGNLWIATYKEIAKYNPGNSQWQIFDEKSGLPSGSINCLALGRKGVIYAGTNYGLFRLGHGPAIEPRSEPVDAEFTETETPIHQWLLRPVSPNDQNCKDQTYLYGSTMGGNFRQHQGNEYNNPEGVPLLAVDDGEIIYTEPPIGYTVLKCNTKMEGKDIYAHYHHQFEIFKKAGDKIKKGDIIGSVGKKGNVTNEHLHFEIGMSPKDSQIEIPTQTRNSELWVAPLAGCGTIVGNLVDKDGNSVQGARIYGITKPVPSETPFSFTETYKEKAHPDNWYNENFAIGDVPEGDYILYCHNGDLKSRIKVHIDAGKFTRVKMILK